MYVQTSAPHFCVSRQQPSDLSLIHRVQRGDSHPTIVSDFNEKYVMYRPLIQQRRAGRVGQPSSTALAPPSGAAPGRAPDARASPPRRCGALCGGGSAGHGCPFRALQFARGVGSILPILPPSAPPRTPPTYLAPSARLTRSRACTDAAELEQSEQRAR